MELLNKEIFKEEMKKLKTIYNYNTTEEQMALYYLNLRNKFTDDIFPLVCKEIILRENFFPSVSTFIKKIPIELSQKAF